MRRFPHSNFAAWRFAAPGLLLAPFAGAAEPPTPAQTPAQPVAKQPATDPNLERVVGELERAGARRPAIDPVGSPTATIAKVAGQARLVPQGTYLPSRKGRLIGSGTAAVFVFAPDPSGHAEPPMVVLPSEYLSAMERSIQERGPETVFTISGQVFAYHNRNYLLIATRPTAEAVAKTEPATKPTPDRTAAPAAIADPAVEKILSELREAGAGSRTAQPLAAAPKGKPDGAGADGKVTVIPEGTFLAARRGRVVRAATGEWVLTFDGDAQGVSEPPMTLFACQNLANIERTAEQRGEAITFTISGQVFSYHDRNFLLPTMYVVNRRSDEVLPNQ